VDEARLSPGALSPSLFLNSPPPVILNFSRNGNVLTLSWTGSGYTLQQNSDFTNPNGWTDLSTTSPVPVTMNAAPKFYRLKK